MYLGMTALRLRPVLTSRKKVLTKFVSSPHEIMQFLPGLLGIAVASKSTGIGIDDSSESEDMGKTTVYSKESITTEGVCGVTRVEDVVFDKMLARGKPLDASLLQGMCSL